MSDDFRRGILAKRVSNHSYDPVERLYQGIKKLRPDIDDKLARKIAKSSYDVGKKYNLDPRDIVAQLRTESGFRTDVVSEAGARGIAQLMPLTYKHYDIDPNDIDQSIDAMGKYLRKNIEENIKDYGSDDLSLAQMRYHAGPNYLAKYMSGAGNDPDKISAPRTKAYPSKIAGYRDEAFGDWRGAVDPEIPMENGDYSMPRSSVSVDRNYAIGKPTSPFDYANIRPAERVSFNKEGADGAIAERVRDINTRYKSNGWNSLSREDKDFFKANWRDVYKAQEGGQTDNYKAEIEGGEYVYNPKGVTDNSFKMLDPSGKKHISPMGFLAQGAAHANDDSGGIKILDGDAYIGSKYLGIDGRKSSNKNPSVASLLIKNGGNVLAKGYQRKSDIYGINPWNPGAMKHHVSLMNEVARDAELSKIQRENEEQEKALFKMGGRLEKMIIPRRYRKYEDGGITDQMSFNTAFGTARKSGMKTFNWRGGVYGTKLKSEVSNNSSNNRPRSDSKAHSEEIYNLPEVVVTAPRIKPQRASYSPESAPVKQNAFDIPTPTIATDYNVIVENKLRAIRRDEQGNPLTSKKDYLILHQTGAPLSNYAKTTDRAGAHYYIGKDGKIYQAAPEEYIAMHAGKGRIGDNYDPNSVALGIEFESLKPSENYEDLTPDQMKTGASFISDWVIRNNIRTEDIPTRIFGHHDITVFDRQNKKVKGYKDPQTFAVRNDPDGPTLQFGQRYYGMSRKPDFDIPTKNKMLDAVSKMVIEKRGYEEGGMMIDPMSMSYDLNDDIYRAGGDFNGSITWLPGVANIKDKSTKVKIKSTKFPRYKADRPRMRSSSPSFGKISVSGRFRKPKVTKTKTAK